MWNELAEGIVIGINNAVKFIIFIGILVMSINYPIIILIFLGSIAFFVWYSVKSSPVETVKNVNFEITSCGDPANYSVKNRITWPNCTGKIDDHDTTFDLTVWDSDFCPEKNKELEHTIYSISFHPDEYVAKQTITICATCRELID